MVLAIIFYEDQLKPIYDDDDDDECECVAVLPTTTQLLRDDVLLVSYNEQTVRR